MSSFDVAKVVRLLLIHPSLGQGATDGRSNKTRICSLVTLEVYTIFGTENPRQRKCIPFLELTTQGLGSGIIIVGTESSGSGSVH